MKRFLFPVVVACLVNGAPIRAAEAIKAAVIRSTGTMFLDQTIWSDLNTGWDRFGTTPVQIDYASLGGTGWGLAQIEATGADVLILSNPAFFTYTTDEIAAVRQYVESGHGLIISYGKFRSADKALAPLVGLSESIQVGTATFRHGIEFDPMVADSPLFTGLALPYASGAQYMAVPTADGVTWANVSGTTVADAYALTGSVTARGIIVANDTGSYRGLYFAHYIEDKSGGANAQDMQMFYNGLVWAGTPEPASVLLLMIGSALLTRRAAKRSR
jgi:hypothetical protein